MCTKAMQSLLLAFWREYSREENRPQLSVSECGPMNGDISLEHKMVAQHLGRLWDTISPTDIDSVRFMDSNPVVDPIVHIADAEWLGTANPFVPGAVADIRSHLTAELVVNNTKMQLEAIEVQNIDGNGQKAVHPDYSERLDRLQFEQDTEFKTTRIGGRNYVVVGFPHGA